MLDRRPLDGQVLGAEEDTAARPAAESLNEAVILSARSISASHR